MKIASHALRSTLGAVLLTLFLTSCWNDDPLFTFSPDKAIEGQWDFNDGIFIWDNNRRTSTVNPVFEDIPSVSLKFADGNRYQLLYSFIVTNGEEDTLTVTNGIQEGTFKLITIEDRVVKFTGQALLTQNITNNMNAAGVRYDIGHSVDTLWVEGLNLNSLLFGEITGVFLRDNR